MICRANQLTGFYLMLTLAFYESKSTNSAFGQFFLPRALLALYKSFAQPHIKSGNIMYNQTFHRLFHQNTCGELVQPYISCNKHFILKLIALI